MLTLGIIPARRGSKGVTRKNLRQVGGISLVGRAIKGAIRSGVIDRVVISTEDEEIRQESLHYGGEVPFLRPEEFAADGASTPDVVADVVERYEDFIKERFEVVVLLEPTSPFRSSEHIKEAVLKYKGGRFRSVISICPQERKPENIFVKSNSNTIERYITDPKERFVRRQDMRHLCRLNSAVYVCGRNSFMTTRQFVMEPVGYVEMTRLESINIDDEVDLQLAELVASQYHL